MYLKKQIADQIADGNIYLGIELGSTRIKAVLIGQDFSELASGTHNWENRLEQGIWTYSIDDVWSGIQDTYAKLAAEVKERYSTELNLIGAIGISGMMHGYLAFGKDDRLLVPFRTWRNTNTERAAKELTELLNFNIPQRWSIAHLYQAILNEEDHIKELEFITTLAGYVHWQLTGEKVVGIGEASGVFPIISGACDYCEVMAKQFELLAEKKGFNKSLQSVLPCVLPAGKNAGKLTEAGARLLDPSGALRAGIPLCPPEGDAGTGMVATNSVSTRTGNVSAGTSIFAMVVMEKALSRIYTEIDMVTTPDGKPVAMVHSNNCTSDLDAWVRMFGEILTNFGVNVQKNELYEGLYAEALRGDRDGGGLLSYNYYSGEPITGLKEGRPLFCRLPDSKMTLANFMRSALYSAMATLKIGVDILKDKENVSLDTLMGHGGLFKTKGVAQNLMASALDVPVAVMESAGEGGSWGMALLAAYMALKSDRETLDDFLSGKVFVDTAIRMAQPDFDDTAGFAAYMGRYLRGLEIQRSAVKYLK